jgi:hypothetical protein
VWEEDEMPSKVRGGRDGIYRNYGPEFTSRVSVGWVCKAG